MKKSSPYKTKVKATKLVQASKLVKKAAARQKVRLNVTNEQMNALLAQMAPKAGAKGLDPNRPFQINFIVEGKPMSNLPVASCAYWGDTCCA